MLTYASKHDFFGQKTRFSDLAISRWSVVSEIDFIQIIKITPIGPIKMIIKQLWLSFFILETLLLI